MSRIRKRVRIRFAGTSPHTDVLKGIMAHLSLYDGRLYLCSGQTLTAAQRTAFDTMGEYTYQKVSGAEFYGAGLTHTLFTMLPLDGIEIIDPLPPSVERMRPANDR